MADGQPLTPEQLQAQVEEERRRYQQLEAQYKGDMEKVYQVLTQNQQQAQQAQQPAEPEWDPTNPQQLKTQVTQAFQQTMQNTLAPVVTTLAGQQFETNMQVMRSDPRFPYWNAWEQEIRQVASQLHPGQLAKLETLQGLYQLVGTRHHREIVEAEVQRRIQTQAEQQPQPDDDVEVDDEEENQEEKPAPKPPVPVTPQPQPQPQRQQARPVTQQPSRSARAPQKIRLTREEAYMADKLGMSYKEYHQAKGLGDAEI